MKKTTGFAIVLLLLIALSACSTPSKAPTTSTIAVPTTTATTVAEKVIEFYPGTKLPLYDCIMDAEKYPSALYYYGPYDNIVESRTALKKYCSIISTDYNFSIEKHDNNKFWIHPLGEDDKYLISCDWVIDGKYYVIFMETWDS